MTQFPREHREPEHAARAVARSTRTLHPHLAPLHVHSAQDCLLPACENRFPIEQRDADAHEAGVQHDQGR